ncbi:MAG: pilus assembly FimT family protein [Candidatus Rokuibacteriota bacterium]
MGAGEEVERRRQAGFTLLELLVTLIVIAVVLGVVTPTIGRSLETLRTRAELAGFAATLRHARELAVTSRVPHAVVVEPAARRVSVREGGPDGEVRETRVLSDRVRIDGVGLTVGFDPVGASTGGEFRLVANDSAWRVTVDPVTSRVRVIRE